MLAFAIPVAIAQPLIDAIPGMLVKQGTIVWACLPVVNGLLVCAPIHLDKFCEMDNNDFQKGVMACVRPLMAEEDGQESEL